MQIDLKNDRIEITTRRSEIPLVCRIPGVKWDSKGGVWHMPASAFTVADLLERFKDYAVEWLSPLLKAFTSDAEGNEALRTCPASELHPATITRHKPWDHQTRAFHWVKRLPACLLDYGMGTGKTKVICDVLASERSALRRVLIVAPKSVLPVWPKQMGIHMLEETLDGIRVLLVNADPAMDTAGTVDVWTVKKGTTVRKTDDLGRHLGLADARKQTAVVIVNYESVWREPLGEFLMKQGWDYVILDESHKAKSPGGKASKFLARLAKVAKRRVCLTGTPQPNSPEDIYGQFRFLDKGVFGTSFHAFKQKYAVMGGFQSKNVVGWKNQEEMNRRYWSITLRADRSVIKLLGSDHVERYCQLEPATKKAYNQLKSTLVAEFESGTITVNNALTKMLRLQQVTSGFLPLVDGEGEERLQQVGTEKRDLLEEVLEDIGRQPIVVFCRFHKDLDAVRLICEKFGWEYCEQSGRAADWTEFARGRYEVIAVQIQSGNAGIDLTRAAYGIYYSVGFSLGDFEQSWCRLDRPGQQNRVTFIHLIAQHTVDEHVYRSLKNKKAVIETLFAERDWMEQ